MWIVFNVLMEYTIWIVFNVLMGAQYVDSVLYVDGITICG